MVLRDGLEGISFSMFMVHWQEANHAIEIMKNEKQSRALPPQNAA